MPIRNIPFNGITPNLPIKIVNPATGNSLRTLALVDTGATACALPGEFATILGHDLTKGMRRKANSAGGMAESYSHSTTIEIYDFKGNRLLVVEKFKVGYMPRSSVSLLGVENFLEKFQLHVDYPGKKFSIRQDTPRVQSAGA